jgi:hypothetical protein
MLDKITVARVRERLNPEDQGVDRTTLWRWVKGLTTPRPYIVDILNEEIDRDNNEQYDWKSACKRAEKKNDKLEKENETLRHNMIFNYSRCTWGRAYPWVILSIGIFCGLVFCARPALEAYAYKLSAGFLNHVYELEGELAKRDIQLKAQQELINLMAEDLEEINKRMEVME